MENLIPIEIELLSQINEFRQKTKMSKSAFGAQSCNNHKIIEKLIAGKDVTSSTINKIRSYLALQSGVDSGSAEIGTV